MGSEPVCNSLQTRLPRGHLAGLVRRQVRGKKAMLDHFRLFFHLVCFLWIVRQLPLHEGLKTQGEFFLTDKRCFLLIRALFCFFICFVCVFIDLFIHGVRICSVPCLENTHRCLLDFSYPGCCCGRPPMRCMVHLRGCDLVTLL